MINYLVDIGLVVISFGVFEWYTKYIERKYGIQKSVSASWYKLRDDGKKKLFTPALWGFSLPISLVGALPEDINWLLVFAGAMICFTAVAPAFKDDRKENIKHMIGAYSGVVLSIVSIIFYFQLYIYASVAIAVALLCLVNIHPDKFKLRLIPNVVWHGERLVVYMTQLSILIFIAKDMVLNYF